MTHVVTSEKEFHTSYEEISRKLRRDSALAQRFRDAYPDWQGEAVNGALVMRSINLYLKTLVSRQSPFDRWIRRETEFYPEDARRGFNVFMGRGLCATCHFAPSFSGTVPPRWAKSESEVLGTWAEFDTLNPRLDPDPGRQGVTPAEHWRGSIKTPSLRNVALTAPYMRNGAFATLEQVLEFYERGGGAGVGLDVPHQTLPNSRLHLTESDKSDLIAFLKTLTDSAVLKR
jgi:cytochrome c peroxidase